MSSLDTFDIRIYGRNTDYNTQNIELLFNHASISHEHVITKLNIDDNNVFIRSLGWDGSTLPFVVVMNDGTVLATFQGSKTITQIEDFIADLI